ncbi:DsbA family protein [Paracidobacterium acidisoli]|uniref:DsbA family protein n=1 Tax=Paracidobacterium acidisoli TaxID=2303751 RepID=UPI0020798342|nr:thioredoxin domain-containing protein [Paracidobacterium acidisoli]
MYRTRFLQGCLVLLLLAAGCKAQTAPVDSAPSAVDRKIELLVRSELNVPPQYSVAVGPHTRSDIPGYDTITITFSLPGHPDHTQTLDYLISKDGNTLARLAKWDISKDPAAVFPIANRPIRGNPAAKVTIVNFDDLECPYCARMHAEFFPATLERYKDLIRIIYLDYPLTELHPWAMHAAVNANCLAAENPIAYWNYVDYLHTHGEDVSGPDHDPAKSAAMLDKLARQEGTRQNVDAVKLDACITKQDDSQIRAEMHVGDRLGVNATPTFFVNGDRWSGALPAADLDLMIDRALRAAGQTPPVEQKVAPATPSQESKPAGATPSE